MSVVAKGGFGLPDVMDWYLSDERTRQEHRAMANFIRALSDQRVAKYHDWNGSGGYGLGQPFWRVLGRVRDL